MSKEKSNNNKMPFLLGGVDTVVRDRFKDLMHMNGVRNSVAPIELFSVVEMNTKYVDGKKRCKYGVIVGLDKDVDSSSVEVRVAPIKELFDGVSSSSMCSSDLYIRESNVYRSIGFSYPVDVQISEQKCFKVKASELSDVCFALSTKDPIYPMLSGRFGLPESLHVDIRELQTGYIAELALQMEAKHVMKNGVKGTKPCCPLSNVSDFGALDNKGDYDAPNPPV